MKNVFSIYQKDMKSIVTNVMTAILVGGLVFLPSLYAWLNIKASWDPYAQTDQIPIGFVNEDVGAEIRGESVHVGDELQATLEENDSFAWKFVDREEGMERVEYGDYYALLILPSDFSEQLGSVASGNPKKAEMEYYVNEKINAIAPKITDKGASVIVEEISSEFISVVNGIIFEMFNDIGLELEGNLPDIEQFEKYVFTLEDDLPEIHDKLVEVDGQVDEATGMLGQVREHLPAVKTAVADGQAAIAAASDFLQKVENDIQAIGPVLADEVEKIEEKFSWQEDIAGKLDGEMPDLSFGADLSGTIDQLNGVIADLEQVQDQLEEPNESITALVESLQVVADELANAQEQFGQLEDFTQEQDELVANVKAVIDEMGQVDMSKFVQEYESTIEPAMLAEVAKGKETLSSAAGLMDKIEGAIPKVDSLLVKVDGQLDEGKEMIAKVLNHFPVIQDKVHTLAERIRDFQSEADLQDIIGLLLNDPEAERSFFAEPVLLHKNEIFPIANYGTGMTPFYTVLALWVGALLLISLLSPNVPEADVVGPKAVYGGRLLTFATIGLLQTLIVTVGDIFIVGVSVSNKLAFVLFGLLISVVFMTIVYTAVAVLGDVGKAVAIILLVLQIASSGGTYPVVLLPEFFQAVNPFLPFTYGVDLMREAVGGIIWERAWKDIGSLAIFAIVFILLGTFLKGPVQAKMSKAMKSKGGRLFH